MNKITNRNQTIDTAKLICLGLMVYCHVPPCDNNFHLVVRSFLMPFFFFVAGLFFHPEKFSFKKGINTLIVPYLIFNCIILLLDCLISIYANSFSWSILTNGIWGILLGSSSPDMKGALPSEPSWFLVAFFLVKYSAKYVIKCHLWIRIILIIVPIIAVFSLRRNWTWCLWSMDSAVLGSIFFYSAYFIREKFLALLDNKKSLFALIAVLPFTCLSWKNGLCNMFACTWGNSILLYLVFAFSGIVSILLICKLIPMNQRVLKIVFEGSMFIICMNMFIIDYVSLVYRRTFSLQGAYCWYDKILIVCIVFLAAYLCTPIILRWCPWVLGKKSVTQRVRG